MLKGLKLMWYNLMSYKYRDVVLKNGNVILGHYFFDMDEDIIIEEYGMMFKNPGSKDTFPAKYDKENVFIEEYYDGHHILSFADIKHNRMASINNAEEIGKFEKLMEEQKPEVREFLEQHKDYFAVLCDLDDSRDSVGIDFETLFIPAVDPRDDYKDSTDRTIETITSATNKDNGLFSGLNLKWYHLVLIGAGLIAISKYLKMW